MMLGVRAHDFGKLPVDELAQRISMKGFKAVQLALSKAISGFDAKSDRLNPGMAHLICDTFLKANLRIAVLGCYINPVHPCEEERRNQIERFKEHIRYARDFGCSIVATETGSLNADFSFHAENHSDIAFRILHKSICELVNEAEKFGVMVAVEGVSSYVAHSPQSIRRIIDEAGSNHLQVILDPVNLLTMENYSNQDSIIKESFKLFGDRIVALHAKDFIIDERKIRSVQAGKGHLNYELIFKLLKEQKPLSYVLMEDTQPDLIDEGINYIEEVYSRV